MIDQVLHNPSVKVIYWAVLLVALILVVWYIRCLCKKSENFGAQAYDSGASMRVTQQEFSSTNQGPNENIKV